MNKKISLLISFFLITSMIITLFTPSLIADPIPQVQTHETTFYQGWNLITIQVDEEFTAETLVQRIPGCTVICMFNADTQMFTSHVTGIPHDDFIIEKGVGYFIYVTEDITCNFIGERIIDLNVGIYPGFNFIGWYGTESINADEIGMSIYGCTTIYTFDGESQEFGEVHTVGVGWTDFMVEPGEGLIAFCNSETIWTGVFE